MPKLRRKKITLKINLITILCSVYACEGTFLLHFFTRLHKPIYKVIGFHRDLNQIMVLLWLRLLGNLNSTSVVYDLFRS